MKKSKKSQLNQVKEYLLRGKPVTNYGSFIMFRTVDLRKIISDLRKTMDIQDKWITSKDGTRFKEYFCSRSYLKNLSK